MKNKTSKGLVLTGLLLVHALASAGPGAAAPPTKTSLEGISAIGSFSHVSQDGCIRTQMTIVADHHVSKDGITQEILGSVAMVQFNACTSMVLLQGFGSTPTPTLIVDKQLTEATMSMTLDFNNFEDGRVIPLTVNVSLVSDAKTESTVTTDVFHDAGIKFFSKATSKVKEGDATATVMIGTELLFEDQPASNAFIASGTEMAITKERTLP